MLQAGCPANAPALCELGECAQNALVGPQDGGGDSLTDAATDGPPAPPGCEKTPAEDQGTVRDDCGVFVAPSGSDTALGTKDAPVRTIAKAIELARRAQKRVFACAATYDERLTIDASVDGALLHGGLVCPGGAATSADAGDAGDAGATDAATSDAATDDGGSVSAEPWTYVAGTFARLAPSTAGAVLTVSKLAVGTGIQDFELVAKDATAPGDSSVAVLVSESRGVSFTRVHVTAGAGAAGAAGLVGTGGALEPKPVAPATSKNGITATGASGAATLVCTCGSSDTTSGGKGGDNDTPAGTAGGNGRANDNPMPYPASPTAIDNGAAGKGRDLTACAEGNRGAQPAQATSGNGGAAAWQLSGAGFVGAGLGLPGQAGKVGQGGGGGGGGTRLPTDGSGGGGGGACGGCGGGAGQGGGPGGSSVGIAVIDSAVELTDSSITTGKGAAGGNGGAGQDGSVGGNGGLQTSNGCAGGDGARGGKGGAGGGGAGGASIAIAYKGAAPATTRANLTLGGAGAGGNDGNGLAVGKGAAGVAAETQVIP